MATSEKDPGNTGRRRGSTAKAAGATAGHQGQSRADWAEELLAVAGQIFDDGLLRRVAASGDEAGQVGDLIIAAHLEDLRMVEQARFHRARRDTGRAMAEGDKDEIARGRERVGLIGADLGLLRMQRDLATGDLEPDVPGAGEPRDPTTQKTSR